MGDGTQGGGGIVTFTKENDRTVVQAGEGREISLPHDNMRAFIKGLETNEVRQHFSSGPSEAKMAYEQLLTGPQDGNLEIPTNNWTNFIQSLQAPEVRRTFEGGDQEAKQAYDKLLSLVPVTA